MNIIKGRTKRANRVLIYGVKGVGKTTLAAKLPAPLILDTEEGSYQLDTDRVIVKSLEKLTSTVEEIVAAKKAGDFDYKTIVLDTADRVWGMCADAYLAENKKKRIGEDKYSTINKEIAEIFSQTLRMFDRVANAGLHIVVICHCRVVRVSPPDNADYSMYQASVTAPGKYSDAVREMLTDWADAVLFCTYETTVDAEKKKAVINGSGSVRKIKTSHTAAWEAKCRIKMPDEVDMTAEAIAPIFPELGGGDTAPKTPALHQEPQHEEPRDPEATRGMDAVPPSGSDPEELGGYARHQQPRQEEAQKDVRSTIPQEILDHEQDVLAYCVRKGGIKEGQGWNDLPQNWVAKMQMNPTALLAAAGITAKEAQA